MHLLRLPRRMTMEMVWNVLLLLGIVKGRRVRNGRCWEVIQKEFVELVEHIDR